MVESSNGRQVKRIPDVNRLISGGVDHLNDDQPRIDEAADQWRLVQGDLAPGETVRLTVQSGSMLPLMPVGARLEVARAEGSDCRVGDVVVFRRAERLVAHRLLFGWGHAPLGWFLQRGDGHSPAGFLRSREVLGRVVAVHAVDGGVRRLTGGDERWQARREARRSLARFVHSLLAEPARKAKRWLTRGNSDSG